MFHTEENVFVFAVPSAPPQNLTLEVQNSKVRVARSVQKQAVIFTHSQMRW